MMCELYLHAYLMYHTTSEIRQPMVPTGRTTWNPGSDGISEMRYEYSLWVVDMSVDSLYADKQKLAPSDFIPAMGTYPVGCSGLLFFLLFCWYWDIGIWVFWGMWVKKGVFGGYGPFLTSVLEDVVENEFNSSPNNNVVFMKSN